MTAMSSRFEAGQLAGEHAGFRSIRQRTDLRSTAQRLVRSRIKISFVFEPRTIQQVSRKTLARMCDFGCLVLLC